MSSSFCASCGGEIGCQFLQEQSEVGEEEGRGGLRRAGMGWLLPGRAPTRGGAGLEHGVIVPLCLCVCVCVYYMYMLVCACMWHCKKLNFRFFTKYRYGWTVSRRIVSRNLAHDARRVRS